jgi:hypothetical protein
MFDERLAQHAALPVYANDGQPYLVVLCGPIKILGLLIRYYIHLFYIQAYLLFIFEFLSTLPLIT